MIYTIQDRIRDILRSIQGHEYILALEGAAYYLGISSANMDRPYITIYTKENIRQNNLECKVVDSFEGIDYIEKEGVYVTTEEQTIVDLLRFDGDNQVIQESIAYWYYRHGEKFDNLVEKTDASVLEYFNDIKEDAIHYYDC